jgi:hypothetical protein
VTGSVDLRAAIDRLRREEPLCPGCQSDAGLRVEALEPAKPPRQPALLTAAGRRGGRFRGIERVCGRERCGRSILVPRYVLARGKGKFCSAACFNAARRRRGQIRFADVEGGR